MTTVLYSTYNIFLQTWSALLEYTINNWPVSPANNIALEDIKSSHDVQQIPAYDIHGNLISPSDYEEKLAGAIAHICLSINHFLIKPKHVFNTAVKDITIMRPPSKITPTTLKQILYPKKKQRVHWITCYLHIIVLLYVIVVSLSWHSQMPLFSPQVPMKHQGFATQARLL